MDFIKKTNPWGSSEEKDDPLKGPAGDPEMAAKQLKAIMQRRMASNKRKSGHK